MSSIPFERYDDEFQSLTQQVQRSLRDPDDLEFTANLLAQSDDLLKQMSVEARGVEDAGVKRDLLSKVRTCKAQLANLKDDYRRMEQQRDKDDLMSGGAGGIGVGRAAANASKERLLSAQSQMEKQNESLDRAKSIMAETEQTAMEITIELGRNRETLESAHGRVREVSGLTNRARRLLQNMNRRQVQQKLALYAVAGVIVLVIGAILWNLK
jgi:vesicle transport through interaction with t-SNAREs 1